MLFVIFLVLLVVAAAGCIVWAIHAPTARKKYAWTALVAVVVIAAALLIGILIEGVPSSTLGGGGNDVTKAVERVEKFLDTAEDVRKRIGAAKVRAGGSASSDATDSRLTALETGMGDLGKKVDSLTGTVAGVATRQDRLTDAMETFLKSVKGK